MATPTTATSSSPSLHSNLNGPDCPPVLYAYPRRNDQGGDDAEHCRHCHSTALFTDWRQGDRICTNCGVVAEELLRDDRPEWKEFSEADDLAKGLPAAARCGMVPVDESKYMGGLQPTTLSKQPFGGSDPRGYAEANVRKRLMVTNRKLDHMMETIHNKALLNAKLQRSIRKKRIQEAERNGDRAEEINCDDLIPPPEYERLLLEEEQDVHRMQTALYAEKWSLDRAILLYGSSHDQHDSTNTCSEGDEERDRLLSCMDSTLRKAAEDLYRAYWMLLQAARRLHLPDRIMNEATNRLVSYVTCRDGFCVKGVSSRLSKPKVGESLAQRKQAAERLRDYNKLKQIGSLGSALLVLTARNLGWTRSVGEVCASFVPFDNDALSANTKGEPFIKPKHCSRALNEIKTTFPDFARSMVIDATATRQQQRNNNVNGMAAENTDSTDHFANHSLRRLQLPPVAEASIATLLAHCRKEQIHLGRNSGTKLSTLCASLAYFVCTAGSVMQRLALQVKASSSSIAANSERKHASKRTAASRCGGQPTKKIKGSHPVMLSDVAQKSNEDDIGEESDAEQLLCDASSGGSGDDDDIKNDDESVPFDVFSHSAITEDRSEKLEYEMRRMWDAWQEQMSWSRTLGEVEQSCGVSRSVVLTFYKSHLFPRRKELLQLLKHAVMNQECNAVGRSSIQGAPFSRMLLNHISTAGPLMNTKGN